MSFVACVDWHGLQLDVIQHALVQLRHNRPVLGAIYNVHVLSRKIEPEPRVPTVVVQLAAEIVPPPACQRHKGGVVKCKPRRVPPVFCADRVTHELRLVAGEFAVDGER